MNKFIIFVHGLGGKVDGTWGKFPQFIIDDGSIEHKVIEYGYTSPNLFKQFYLPAPTILSIANGLLTDIQARCDLQNDDIILVGHSMGGLVIRKMLLRLNAKGINHNIRKICFFDVPHEGSGFANIGKHIAIMNRHLKALVRNASELDDLNEQWADKKLDEHNKKLNQYQEESVQSRKLTVLQMELSRLRGSAELIDRSIKNVKIHASSLSVHYQNIRNINGLIEDVNTLRYGLKAVISTINHNSKNLGGEENGFKKIEGVDINKKQGAISQVAAFDAFDRTRELLKDEVFELSLLSTKHLKDVERLKIHAANVGGDIGRQVIDCIDRDVIPVFKNAESAGLLLKSEVSRLPVAARDDAGMLKFDNGKIMIESDSLG